MIHEHEYGDCPRCGAELSLTTGYGWTDRDTCTAVLCCAYCRILSRYSEAAVVIHDGDDEDDAISGIDADLLRSQMDDAMDA